MACRNIKQFPARKYFDDLPRAMIFRAIAAFLTLPGLVAFAIPIAIGLSTNRPVRLAGLAAIPLCLGTLLLLWCVLWDSRTLIVYAVCFAIGFHLRVLVFEEPWAARQFGAEWQAYRARVSRGLI